MSCFLKQNFSCYQFETLMNELKLIIHNFSWVHKLDHGKVFFFRLIMLHKICHNDHCQKKIAVIDFLVMVKVQLQFDACKVLLTIHLANQATFIFFYI